MLINEQEKTNNPYRNSNKLKCSGCGRIKICPRFNDIKEKDGSIHTYHYMKEHKNQKGSTCPKSDKIIHNAKKFYDDQQET